MSHEDLRRSLATYVLGSLSPSDRHEVDVHLSGCAGCREELASYAGVPGLLSRLSLGEATTGELLPPPTLLPSLLAAVETERTHRRRQVSRWRLASASLVAAAAVVGVLAATAGPAPTATPGGRLVAEGASVSAGSATVQPRPWGTELRLVLRDLPPSDGFEAYAVDGTGARTLAASWGPTADGRAEVPAATAVPVAELARLVVQTRQGVELLSLAR